MAKWQLDIFGQHIISKWMACTIITLIGSEVHDLETGWKVLAFCLLQEVGLCNIDNTYMFYCTMKCDTYGVFSTKLKIQDLKKGGEWRGKMRCSCLELPRLDTKKYLLRWATSFVVSFLSDRKKANLNNCGAQGSTRVNISFKLSHTVHWRALAVSVIAPNWPRTPQDKCENNNYISWF